MKGPDQETAAVAVVQPAKTASPSDHQVSAFGMDSM
jgi:hypothetical protein